MTSPTAAPGGTSARTNLQKAALAVGVVFLAVGVLGFIPGVKVSILHNIVHLLFGVAGILMARSFSGARTYLVFGGAIYLVLFLYGLLIGQESAANFVPVNLADDILHLLLGIGMIGLGLALSRGRTAATTTRI
jgi:hypothetical protein